MCKNYEAFDIVEVAKRCGIHFWENGSNGNEFKAQCPFCGDKRYHLGINREMERFHCFKCGEKGNSVSLFAKINGVSNKEAYEALKNADYVSSPKMVPFVSNPETPIKPLEERHNVYYDMLKLLRLQPCHRANLMNRGLTFPEIHRFMYKSIPLDNVFRREVIERLAAEHDLIGIPGFYRDYNGDIQMYIHKYGGMFVPYCNKDGYIQGLQMRLDIPEGSRENKFRWFSTRDFNEGTKTKSWVHVVGDTTATEACLTEGAMKCDIASVLSGGRLFLAVPGVKSIGNLMEVINDLGIIKIHECFDMDKRSKPEVKKDLIALRNLLQQNHIECHGCSWNPAYKGLDDYYLAKSKSMMQPMAA